MNEDPILNADFWNRQYSTGNTAWDIGRVSAPLQNYFEQLTQKNAAILIPGCGNGYEAGYLLSIGFTNVTVVDISIEAVNAVKQNYPTYLGKALQVVQGNFFELQASFDLIVEQTFFCALHPAWRQPYALQVHRLLKPGGKLAGVFFNRNFEAGPPFGGSLIEYKQLFGSLFQIKTMEPCYNSIAPRAGTECFVILQK